MVEIYKNQIAQTEDLVEIAEMLASDSGFKKRALEYISKPYDTAKYLKGLEMPPVSFNRKGETIYLAGNAEGGKTTAETEATIAKCVEKGLVCADGVIVKKCGHSLKKGDAVTLDIPDPIEKIEKKDMFAPYPSNCPYRDWQLKILTFLAGDYKQKLKVIYKNIMEKRNNYSFWIAQIGSKLF